SLYNLDRDVLVAAGVIDFGTISDTEWRCARDNPAQFVLKLDDDRLAKLWALVEAQQPAVPEDRAFLPAIEVADREVSLRDRFAGQALTGIIAFPGAVHGSMTKNAEPCAVAAYAFAD